MSFRQKNMNNKVNYKYKYFSLAITWILGFVGAITLIAALYTAFLGREFVVLGNNIYDSFIYINSPGSTQIAGMEGYGITTYGENGLVVNKSLKDNVKRVLFWGDSFVKAIQVSDSDKFTEVIEREWNNKFPTDEIQTLNIGQAGLDTRAYIQFSNNVDKIYSPDMVFLMLGESDFDALANRRHLEKQIKAQNYDSLLTPESPSKLRIIISEIGLHAFVVRLKRQTFAFLKGSRNAVEILETHNDLDEHKFRESIETQLDALHSIWGDRLVIIYRHRISDYGYNLEHAQESAFYRAMNQNKINFVDTHTVLSAAMKEGMPPHGFMNFNLGHGHFNQTGHKIVAELVLNYLEASQ